MLVLRRLAGSANVRAISDPLSVLAWLIQFTNILVWD